MSGSTSRRRGEAERKVTDVALLGRLDGSLEVECRLLCDERGREERCVRLADLARRGLRGTEIGVWTFVPVPHGAGGSESESDEEYVVVVVEHHQVEEDDLE